MKYNRSILDIIPAFIIVLALIHGYYLDQMVVTIMYLAIGAAMGVVIAFLLHFLTKRHYRRSKKNNR